MKLNELVKNKKYSKYIFNTILKRIVKIIGKVPQFDYNDEDQIKVLNVDETHHEKIWKILNNFKKKLESESIILSINYYDKYDTMLGDGDDVLDIKPNKDVPLVDYYIRMKDLILKRIVPNKYVYHFTPEENVKLILKKGLLPGWGQNWAESGEAFHTEHPPAVFAIDDDQQGWYGDVKLRIDTTMIDNKWYQDLNFPHDEKVIMTFNEIPTEAISIVEDYKRESFKYLKTFESFNR